MKIEPSSQCNLKLYLIRTYSPQCHITWKYRRRLTKSLHNPVFLVNGDEQWIALPSLLRNRLQTRSQLKNLPGLANIARKQENITHVVARNQVDDFLGRCITPETNHQHLPNLLLQRHAIGVVVHVSRLPFFALVGAGDANLTPTFHLTPP